jgi:hypothetical protein
MQMHSSFLQACFNYPELSVTWAYLPNLQSSELRQSDTARGSLVFGGAKTFPTHHPTRKRATLSSLFLHSSSSSNNSCSYQLSSPSGSGTTSPLKLGVRVTFPDLFTGAVTVTIELST